MIKFYAIACNQAEAIKNCYTGKYTNQPFWPQYNTILPIFKRVQEENPEIPLKIYVVKVSE